MTALLAIAAGIAVAWVALYLAERSAEREERITRRDNVVDLSGWRR